MPIKFTQLSACAILLSAALLSGCGEGKDEKLSALFTDCQLRAHSSSELDSMNDEQRHFAAGAFVEKCLSENGLQPASDSTSGDCYESPEKPEQGKGFVKPMQKCWKKTGKS